MDPLVLFMLTAIVLGVICRLFMFVGNLIAHLCSKASWMSHLQFFALAALVAGTAILLLVRGAQALNQVPILGGMFLVFTSIGMCQTWLNRHRR